MFNNYIDISQLALSQSENEALLLIQSEGVIPDTVLDQEPYAFFLRQGLIEHTFSDKYPDTDYVPGVISIPRNALCLADRGRCFIALQEEKARTSTVGIEEALREQNQQMADHATRQEAQHNEDKADRKAEAKKDRHYTLLAAIISGLAGSILTLLIEHPGWIAAFFGRLMS